MLSEDDVPVLDLYGKRGLEAKECTFFMDDRDSVVEPWVICSKMIVVLSCKSLDGSDTKLRQEVLLQSHRRDT